MNLRLSKKPNAADGAIAAAYEKIADLDPQSKEYAEAIHHINELIDSAHKSRVRVSPDTLVKIAGNLLIVVVVIAFEQEHVFPKSALGFFSKN